MNFFITTSPASNEIDMEMAQHLAKKFNIPFIPRSNYTISFICRRNSLDGALIVNNEEVTFIQNKKSFSFHPNMASLRINNLTNGKRDRLIELSEATSGERVLDCTLGMASDAMVFSHAVGKEGEVVGLEKSGILKIIVETGLKKLKISNIRVIDSDYSSFLTKEKDNSFDIVYLDPMFDKSLEKSNGLELVRRLAEYTPLTEGDIKEAVRISRRYVIVKDGREGSTLKRLNIPIFSKGRKICYGRISKITSSLALHPDMVYTLYQS